MKQFVLKGLRFQKGQKYNYFEKVDALENMAFPLNAFESYRAKSGIKQIFFA